MEIINRGEKNMKKLSTDTRIGALRSSYLRLIKIHIQTQMSNEKNIDPSQHNYSAQ